MGFGQKRFVKWQIINARSRGFRSLGCHISLPKRSEFGSICFCSPSQMHNLFMSIKHYITLPHCFIFSQILNWVAAKVISSVPRQREKSGPGGAQGHANATGQGGSRKYGINRESHPTLKCPAEPRENFRWHPATPQNWTAQATTPSCSWSCPQERPSCLAHSVLIKEDKIKVAYVSWSKLFHVSTVFSYTQLHCNQDSQLLQ